MKTFAKFMILESVFDDIFQKWKEEGNDVNLIEEYIDKFKIFKQRNFLQGPEVDISPWSKKSFNDFKTWIDQLDKKYKQKITIKQTESNVDKIFENDQVLIVCPNTFEASQKYGANTKWCISGHVKQHWNNYRQRGTKFYFILPKHNNHKLAVTVYPNNASTEIYNERDEIISIKTFNLLLKQYQIPKTVLFTNKIDWNEWLNRHEHVKNSDGSIDIFENVLLNNLNLTKLPFKFRYIKGNFDCSCNNLTSLEGSPQNVKGIFNCSYNKLTSLEGSPQNVKSIFNCSYNKLTSLEGSPQEVFVDFYCSHNNLTSLKGSPQNVKGIFNCSYNNLTSLEGSPQNVGYFYCYYNNLTSLKGGPQKVEYVFNCSYNYLISLESSPRSVSIFYCNHNNLTSLKGSPQNIKGIFSCSYNNLTSLEGGPQNVKDVFNCSYNKLTSLKGFPQNVDVDFNCSHNYLTSLEGSPRSINANFNCSYNYLTSLEGGPQIKGNHLFVFSPQIKGNPLKESLDLGDNSHLFHSSKQELYKNPLSVEKILPDLGPEAQRYIEFVTSEGYKKALQRLEYYTKIKPSDTSIPQLFGIVFDSLSQIITFQNGHKKELEQLALNNVLNLEEFKLFKDAYQKGLIKFDIKLENADLSKAKLAINQPPPSKRNLSKTEKANIEIGEKMQNLNDNILKRQFANLISHGNAVNKFYLFQLVSDQLNKINPNLVNLYGIVSTICHLGYYGQPLIELTELSLLIAAVGSVQIIPEGDAYIIKARSLFYPYLIHEIVKGCYDYLSMDLVPQEELNKEVIDDEDVGLMSGPDLFLRITRTIPKEYEYLTPLIYKLLLREPPETMKAVLLGGSLGQNIIQKLITQAKQLLEDSY